MRNISKNMSEMFENLGLRWFSTKSWFKHETNKRIKKAKK